MAHIVLRPSAEGPPAMQLIINGQDYSMETYPGFELVEVGEGEFAEVGFRVTFAVTRLDLGGDDDVVVTDHFYEVAQRVRSMAADPIEDDAPDAG